MCASLFLELFCMIRDPAKPYYTLAEHSRLRECVMRNVVVVGKNPKSQCSGVFRGSRGAPGVMSTVGCPCIPAAETGVVL